MGSGAYPGVGGVVWHRKKAGNPVEYKGDVEADVEPRAAAELESPQDSPERSGGSAGCASVQGVGENPPWISEVMVVCRTLS